MKVKIKKLHPDAVIPKYAKEGDAGMDLTAISAHVENENIIIYDTGLSIEIPEGYVGFIFPRSSIYKKDLVLCNHVGVVDSSYRGPIKLIFKQDISKDNPSAYKLLERIGQLIIMPYPKIEFEEVNELSETERGESGFGSSGN